jgi:hypothetical protein
MVVARKRFENLFDRSDYQIHGPEIATGLPVYSEAEFEKVALDGSSFVAQNLTNALEL